MHLIANLNNFTRFLLNETERERGGEGEGERERERERECVIATSGVWITLHVAQRKK